MSKEKKIIDFLEAAKKRNVEIETSPTETDPNANYWVKALSIATRENLTLVLDWHMHTDLQAGELTLADLNMIGMKFLKYYYDHLCETILPFEEWQSRL